MHFNQTVKGLIQESVYDLSSTRNICPNHEERI